MAATWSAAAKENPVNVLGTVKVKRWAEVIIRDGHALIEASRGVACLELFQARGLTVGEQVFCTLGPDARTKGSAALVGLRCFVPVGDF